MLKSRMIGGAAVVAVTLLCVLLGGYFTFFYVAILSLIGLWEFYKASGMEKSLPAVAGYIGAVVYEVFMFLKLKDGPFFAVAISVLMIMAVYVFTFPRFRAPQIFTAVAGIIYVVLLMSFVYYTRIMENGLYIAPLIYICAWGNDTCAYFTGISIGKHKMTPELSPKKSVEGLIGGILGAAVIGLLYGFLFGKHLTAFGHPAPFCCIISAVGALLAVIGDLSASAIKRDTGIKDYGNLIPGHGGVLDRFDSILYTAPAVYMLACLMTGALW